MPKILLRGEDVRIIGAPLAAALKARGWIWWSAAERMYRCHDYVAVHAFLEE